MDSSIQIIGLRPYINKDGKEKLTERFLGENWRFDTVENLFNSAHRAELIQKIPERERFNIYWTAAKCWEGTGRKLAEQDIIPFDIDKLNLPDTWTEEQCHTHANQVAQIVCEVLRVRYEDCGILFSGNGVWVIVRTTKPWSDPEYFEKTRIYYDDILKKINQLLRERGYEGTADSTGWGHGKLIRFPDTENVKKDKPRRYARVLNEHIRAIDWTIEEACPELKIFEQAETATNIPFSNPDVEGILAECKFLADRATDHASEPEYEWYARAGLYAFFPKGKDQLFHDHSKQYYGYSEYETNFKLEQARAAQKGPRLCDNIAKITNNKYCQQCKHYQQIKTPFQIVSANFIRSEHTGFWAINKQGVPSKPMYDDLVKAFIKDFYYVSVRGQDTIMVYEETHWKEMDDQDIKAWVTSKVNPAYMNHQKEEFIQALHTQPGRIKDRKDFDLGAFGKMNFKNCILDTTTMQTHPHSPEYLLTYILPYAYDPRATAPAFEKFITDVTSHEDDALTLKEFIGYVASGDPVSKRGRALILVGTGSNGKGVYSDLIKNVVGEENASAKGIERLTQRPFTRSEIMYKLVNISTEGSENAFKESEVFKQMTNGEQVTAERKYKGEVDYVNRTKLVIAMNHAPKIYDDSHGFSRRLLVIKFDKRFEGANEDPTLELRLEKETPGILNVCLKAYLDMKKRGIETHVTLPFKAIPRSNETVKQMKDDEDPLVQFCLDRIMVEAEHEEAIPTFYKAYVDYCDMFNVRNKLLPSHFSKKFRDRFKITEDRRSAGRTFVKGYKLTEF